MLFCAHQGVCQQPWPLPDWEALVREEADSIENPASLAQSTQSWFRLIFQTKTKWVIDGLFSIETTIITIEKWRLPCFSHLWVYSVPTRKLEKLGWNIPDLWELNHAPRRNIPLTGITLTQGTQQKLEGCYRRSLHPSLEETHSFTRESQAGLKLHTNEDVPEL